MIYFDNAATSWPKPGSVEAAMMNFMREVGANPGRSGHRLSVAAARIIFNTREKIARLFNVRDPLRVVFGANATDAINLALSGLLRPGDHVITSAMEHNSMMRPLHGLMENGIEVSVVPCSGEGFLDPGEVKTAIKKNTVLIAINHGSNVNGCIQPLKEIGEISRACGLTLLVDSAQSAGCIDIDVERDNIDLLAFTGHKGLFGPQGTGGLVLGDSVDIKNLNPSRMGGTGSRSEFEVQPDFLPDRYESGTPNTVGIAGLGEGVGFVLEKGIEEIQRHEFELMEVLLRRLEPVRGIQVYAPGDSRHRLATVSFTLHGIGLGEAGLMLDERYSILSRVGLHCSPAAHRTLGTFPSGTIRFSLGYFNTVAQVETATSALEEITAVL